MFSCLYDISKSTVSKYLVTWTNLLYACLGKNIIWPSKVQVLDIIPKTFKITYPLTTCINDGAEIFR